MENVRRVEEEVRFENVDDRARELEVVGQLVDDERDEADEARCTIDALDGCGVAHCALP